MNDLQYMTERARLATATPVHYHTGQYTVHNIQVNVEVHHRYGGHFSGRTAWPDAELRHLHQMRMRVLRKKHGVARTGTVVRHVRLRRDDPMPAEIFEVDSKWVPTASGLRGRLVAKQAGTRVPLGPGPSVVHGVHLQVRDLARVRTNWIRENGGTRGCQTP